MRALPRPLLQGILGGKEVQARGIDAPRLEIFQFCDPEDAIKMVQYNTIYAAYTRRTWVLGFSGA